VALAQSWRLVMWLSSSPLFSSTIINLAYLARLFVASKINHLNSPQGE
jgi:hypothetical protein